MARVSRTTGQEVLFLLALAFAGAFVWWWYQAWSVLFPAESLLSAVGIFKLMISLVYGVVVPLFWSMLLPNSPTGSYLQKQTWAQPGQIAVFVFAIVLSFFGFRTMWTWLNSVAPDLMTTGMFWPAIAAAMVGSTFVPAMQFAYQTPGQQMLIIQQAHEIRKLRKFHDGELAIIEGRMLRAAVLANMSWAEMLPDEREEVYQTVKGMFLSIADTQRKIARVQNVPADIQRALGIAEEKDVIEHLEVVREWLEKPADQIELSYQGEDVLRSRRLDRGRAVMPSPALDPEREAEVNSEQRADARRVEGRPAADRIGQPAHVNTRPQSSIPRESESRGAASPDATRRQAAPYGVEYARAAWDKLGRQPWTVKALAAALSIGDTKARELKDHWLEDGIINETGQLGRWYFTESGAR